MTKGEAKKVIECAVKAGICPICPKFNMCSGLEDDCEKHVHEAANVLYGGGELSRREKLAEKFMDIYWRTKGDFGRLEIDNSFILADYFINKSQETDE